MAISFNVIATNSTPADPLSINPGATANDVLILGVISDNNGTSMTAYPASFDQLVSPQVLGSDGQVLFTARKKTASGSEGALSINPTTNIIGFIMAISGADNTTPEDVTPVTANDDTADGTPWTIDASITPVTDGCMIVAIMGSDTLTSVDAVHSFSTTSGTTGAWTVRADQRSAFYNVAVATAVQTTAGAITVRGEGAVAGASAARSICLIAVRPAAAAGGTGRLVNGCLVNGLLTGYLA